jgi:hypothetical protein
MVEFLPHPACLDLLHHNVSHSLCIPIFCQEKMACAPFYNARLGIFSLDRRSPPATKGIFYLKKDNFSLPLGHQEHFSGYKHRIYYSIFYPETKIKLNGFFLLSASDGSSSRNPSPQPPSSVVKMETNGKSFSSFLMSKSLSLHSRLS